MKYKVIDLSVENSNDLITELMFELASARAEKVELVRLNVMHTNETVKKNVGAIMKTLKNMKSKGRIQFYATKDDFEISSTEAVFLNNKYPDIFTNIPDLIENTTYFYVKL